MGKTGRDTGGGKEGVIDMGGGRVMAGESRSGVGPFTSNARDDYALIEVVRRARSSCLKSPRGLSPWGWMSRARRDPRNPLEWAPVGGLDGGVWSQMGPTLAEGHRAFVPSAGCI